MISVLYQHGTNLILEIRMRSPLISLKMSDAGHELEQDNCANAWLQFFLASGCCDQLRNQIKH